MELKKLNSWVTICIALVLVSGCEQDEIDNCKIPFDLPIKTKFIGHKGSGPIDEFNNPNWHENGKPSVLNALKLTDGSEVDIQMSADSTLWLFHDHIIKTCKGDSINFALLKDTVIQKISVCNYGEQMQTLEEFSLLFLDEAYKDSYISLDLKVLSNPEIIKQWEEDKITPFVFDQIERHLNIKNLALEIPENISYENAKKYSERDLYQVYYTSETVSTNKNKRLSIPFNMKIDQDLPYKNLQFWTPNNLSDMITAMEEKPSFIQSDNTSLASFLIKLRKKGNLICLPTIDIETNGMEDEFLALIPETSMPNSDVMFRIELDKTNVTGEQILVLSIKNESGKNIHWESINVLNEHPYLFLNHNIGNTGNEKYTVYIWNKLKTPVTLSGKLKSYTH